MLNEIMSVFVGTFVSLEIYVGISIVRISFRKNLQRPIK